MADWGDGVSASCIVGPIVRQRRQWMAQYCKALVTSLTPVSGAITSVHADIYLYFYVTYRLQTIPGRCERQIFSVLVKSISRKSSMLSIAACTDAYNTDSGVFSQETFNVWDNLYIVYTYTLFRQARTNFGNFGSTASAHFQKLYAYSTFIVPSLLLTLFALK